MDLFQPKISFVFCPFKVFVLNFYLQIFICHLLAFHQSEQLQQQQQQQQQEQQQQQQANKQCAAKHLKIFKLRQP